MQAFPIGVVASNTIIHRHSVLGNWKEAIRAFKEMHRCGLPSNVDRLFMQTWED